ncbi:MAG: outer membrane beta-barrel protein [bacterium]|nr:outer membrane beta-barrel protein [bacterium]
MKKMIGVVILFLLVVSIPLLADGVRKNSVIVSGGYATTDMEALFVDFGFEMQISGDFYGQFIVEYYNKPFEELGNTKSSGWGFNLYGVYKFPASEKLNLFVKGGVYYTNMDFDFDDDDTGFNFNLDLPSFGAGFGGGVEYRVGKKMAIHGGTTYKVLSGSDSSNWFKFYTGFSYGIK